MKKYLSALLMITLLLTAAPMTAFAAEAPVPQVNINNCFIYYIVHNLSMEAELFLTARPVSAFTGDVSVQQITTDNCYIDYIDDLAIEVKRTPYGISIETRSVQSTSAGKVVKLLLSAAPILAFPVEAPVPQITTDNCYIHYIDDLPVKVNLTSDGKSVQTRSVQNTSAGKVVTAKNSAGKTIATYTLHGTFRYDGESAVCTSADYSASTSDSTWSFSSANARANKNKAHGFYTLVRPISGQTVSDEITINCSPTGKIS